MNVGKNDIFALIKTRIDAHTMGIHATAALLRESGYRVIIAPAEIESAVEKIAVESNQNTIKNWIIDNNIAHIGFSYRLDSTTAIELLGRLLNIAKNINHDKNVEVNIKNVFFAGISQTCDLVEKEFLGEVETFRGGESVEETLIKLGVPPEEIPKNLIEGCSYDKELKKFGEKIIKEANYKSMVPPARKTYSEFGTYKDTLELRIDNNYDGEFQPIIRAHSGPYNSDISREECLKQYINWCNKLSEEKLLDVLSIGTSQLTQSNFGEDWFGKQNGGGVPVNSELEYIDIWNATRPMLVRTYSATKNIKKMADVYEKTINNAWHALSIWWFNELDGRGENSLLKNIKEHLDTIKYVASIGKPFEANVPHHFAFRGSDDVTYILSAYIVAKLAKKYGVKTFVLQNMLNTPRGTWGIQDLAKSRVMLKLVKELEDENFRVILQTRAGLDYFKPDIDTAKEQLASVTALMDDIEPLNVKSPEIIHVVSYSEALFLATPEILNDSIRITRTALNEYRKMKKRGLTFNVENDEIYSRQCKLEMECRKILKAMEDNISNLYSPEGLYLAFVGGWMPVPELWSNSEEFKFARDWETSMWNGSMILTNEGKKVSIEERINKCLMNMKEAEYILKHNSL